MAQKKAAEEYKIFVEIFPTVDNLPMAGLSSPSPYMEQREASLSNWMGICLLELLRQGLQVDYTDSVMRHLDPDNKSVYLIQNDARNLILSVPPS
jgi:hypothetical protein